MFRLRILFVVFLSVAFLTGARNLPVIDTAGPWVYLRGGQPLPAGDEAVEVVAVGDVNLARGMAGVADPFTGVAGWLRLADLALGNLESVIIGTADDGRRTTEDDRQKTKDEGEQQGKEPYVLIAPTEAVEKLVGAGFDLLGLANNHSLDAGPGGLAETVERLDAAGIKPVGAGVDSFGAPSAVIRTVKGVRLAFLAFNDVAEGEGNLTPLPPSRQGKGDFSPLPLSGRGAGGVRFINAVRRARQQADGVIVSIHWGYEYERRRDPAQVAIAQALLDAGADVVIGHHPHVAQEITVFEGDGASGRLVAFSLGNFAFDQSFGDTRQGLALRLFFDQKGLRAAQVLPVRAGPRPRLLDQDEAASLLEHVLVNEPLAGKTALAYTCGHETCTPTQAFPAAGSGIFTTGQVDLTGDGLAEDIHLEGQRLSIYEKGVKTWESPPEWRVSDLATGDPDGDGREDLMLALWKPDKQGSLRSHPFVFGYRGGRYRTVWGGSAVGRRIHAMELGDLDGDGFQELVVLEETPDGIQRTVSVWRWHGWGFRCDWRSPAGDFNNLKLFSGTEGMPPRFQIEAEP